MPGAVPIPPQWHRWEWFGDDNDNQDTYFAVGRFLVATGIVDLATGTTIIREENLARHEFSVYRGDNLEFYLDLKTTPETQDPGLRIGDTEYAVNNNWHDFQFELGASGFSSFNPEAVRSDRPVRLVVDYRLEPNSASRLIGFMFAANVDKWALFHSGTVLAARSGFESGPVISVHSGEPTLELPPPAPPTTTSAPAPTFSFTRDHYTVTEGETVRIGVRKTGGAQADFSLVRIGGSAASSDFVVDAYAGVELSTGQFVRVDTAVGRFNLLGIRTDAGAAEVVIPLQTKWDTLSESPETLELRLEIDTDLGFEFGEYRTTTITILNAAPTTAAKPVIQWRGEDLNITINEHGGTDTGHQFVGDHYTPTIEVEVRLAITPAGAVPFDNVLIGVSGTAAGSIYPIDGDDFSITRPTLTLEPHVIILPPDNIRSGLVGVRLNVLVDQVHGEPDETIILTLQPDNSAYTLGANTVAAITITDIPPTTLPLPTTTDPLDQSDQTAAPTTPAPPQLVSWGSAAYSGVEPAAGDHAEDAYHRVRVTITRAGGVDRPVLFDISHGAGVVLGTEYADNVDVVIDGVVSTDLNNRYQLAAARYGFYLRVHRDYLVEGDETLTLILVQGPGYVPDTAANRHITTVTLTDTPPLPIPAGERWFEWSLTIDGRGARYIHYRVRGEFRTRNTTGTVREADVYYHVIGIEIIDTHSDTTYAGAVIDLVNGELNGSAEGITVYHDFEFELPGVGATGPFYFSVNSEAQDPVHATIFMAERTSDLAKWGTHNHPPLRFWDTFSASENPITLTSQAGPVVREKIRQ